VLYTARWTGFLQGSPRLVFAQQFFLSVVFFSTGIPPLGWRFVTKIMLENLELTVFGKSITIRKISKSCTHCFKPDCLKRIESSCILPGISIL
jgi:hypothetical protein